MMKLLVAILALAMATCSFSESLCCYSEGGDCGNAIYCVKKHEKVILCNEEFRAANDCGATFIGVHKCCYADPCTGERICERGGAVVKSCRKLYRVNPLNCKLDYLRTI